MTVEACPACHSSDVDPVGHVITLTAPGSAETVSRGPACRTCGFWSARGDWSDAENLAGWNGLERPA